MSESEASFYYLRIDLIRASINITNIDWQSIMFSSAWSNPFIYTLAAYNESATINNAYLDLDGSLMEAYSPVSFHMKNSFINITNY